MTKISKKAQAAETKAEAVNTPAEPKTELVEAPKEQALEEPTKEELPSLDEIKAKERALRKR